MASSAQSLLDGYDSDGNDLLTGLPPENHEGGNSSELGRLDGRPVRSKREPKRLVEQIEPEPKKKRMKTQGQGKMNAATKKKINEITVELEETKAELNASKATCDDLQMLLEEREQAGNTERKKINDLETLLSQKEDIHQSNIRKLKLENEKIVKELKARIKCLEGKSYSS